MVTEAVWLESVALGPGRHIVRELEGNDRLNHEYRFRARLTIPRVLPTDELERLLDAPARLLFSEGSRDLSCYSGVLAAVAGRAEIEDSLTDLEVELVPRVALGELRHGSQLYLSRTVPEVVSEKLTSWGLEADRDFRLALRRAYPKRELIAQHEETDLVFVRRLCERAGITTRYEETDRGEVLVFTDEDGAFSEIARPVLWARKRTEHPAAYEVRTTLRRIPGRVTIGDYNYRSPNVSLHAAKAIPRPAVGGTWSEFGHHHKTPEESSELATMRADELASRHQCVQVKATEASLRAGGLFNLRDAGGTEQRLFITRVRFSFSAIEEKTDPESERGWRNELEAIPAETRFRPTLSTEVPRISGLLNAVVDGAIRGDYAELDELGRYHLRLALDTSGRTDLTATHPVRMLQPHSGAHYGMHFPLRPGTEVMVGFVNGDPDRPVIVGASPNPLTNSPVARKNQTQNVLRTGANNEMVIEDAQGSERIRLYTPHRSTTLQLGAPDEAEEGVLLSTEANVTSASRISNNTFTTTQTTIARSATTLAGRRAIWLAGFESIDGAATAGIEDPAAFTIDALAKDLRRLGRVGSGVPKSEGTSGSQEVVARSAPLHSDLAREAAQRSEELALGLVRSVARGADEGLASARGRIQGAPVGVPNEPAVILASERTAALIGRDVGLLAGDRVVMVSSGGTAAVLGGDVALVKSGGNIEIAAPRTVQLTSAGIVDIAAMSTQLVAGYDPQQEVPRIDEGTSLGLMARRDLRVHSVEDCVLLCAQKNLVGSAHQGDVRLHAGSTVSLRGGSIEAASGEMSFEASRTLTIKADGDIVIEAGGNMKVKAASVTIEAAEIHCVGNVRIDGNLFVAGSRNF